MYLHRLLAWRGRTLDTSLNKKYSLVFHAYIHASDLFIVYVGKIVTVSVTCNAAADESFAKHQDVGDSLENTNTHECYSTLVGGALQLRLWRRAAR